MARGDHIYVQRLGGTYSHHGIDCGDDTVIHYTSPQWISPRRISRTTLEVFARDGEIRVRDYADFFARLRNPENLPRRIQLGLRRQLSRLVGTDEEVRQFGSDAVIARAESRLGESYFDLVLHNCEHFATWCKTGISDSEQIYALWKAALDPLDYLRMRQQGSLLALFEPNWRVSGSRRGGGD